MALKNETFTPANATMLHLQQGSVPEEFGLAILKEVMANSVIMQLGQFEPMTEPKKTFDVFLGGVGAYWVGEGQRIETTAPKWTQVSMEAKKLGVILPVSREYLSYKQADFFEFMKPYLAEALYKKFDAATLLNVDNPYSQSIDQSITTAGQGVEGTITTAKYDAMIAKLNDQGYEPNAIISKVANTTALRGMVRDENGMKNKVYQHNPKQLDGVPVYDINKDIAEFGKGTLYACLLYTSDAADDSPPV